MFWVRREEIPTFSRANRQKLMRQTTEGKNIGTHSVRELFCSCQEEVRKWLLNERACTKVHYWDVVYLSSVELSKSIGF